MGPAVSSTAARARARTGGACRARRWRTLRQKPHEPTQRGSSPRARCGVWFLRAACLLAGARAQSCAGPSGGVLHTWCLERCLQMYAWLRFRVGYHHFAEATFEENAAMSVWDGCPHAYTGLLFARATSELRRLSRPDGDTGAIPHSARVRARELLWTAEYYTRDLFENGMNLTRYLHPKHLSFALFAHLGDFVHALRAFPDVLDAPASGCAPCGGLSRGCGLPSTNWGVSAGLADEVRALEEYAESDSIDNSTDFEAHAQAAAALGGRCALPSVALHLAAVDIVRLRQGIAWDGAAGDRIQLQLKAAQACFRRLFQAVRPRSFIAHVAAGCVPVFELLDRLDRQIVLPMTLEAPAWKDRVFWMHILPTRNIESNIVRSMLSFHCDVAFQEFVEARHARRRAAAAPFLMVEVGAHLGGCTLHALTHLGPDVRALAIEPYGPAAAGLRRTAAANGLSDRLLVVERFVSDRAGATYVHRKDYSSNVPYAHQPAWVMEKRGDEPGGGASPGTSKQNCMGLEDILRVHGISAVDIIRVHVNGLELSVLRSARPLFDAGMVAAVAVAIFGPRMEAGVQQDAPAIGQLLRHHNFDLYYEGKINDDAEALLADTSRPAGTSTLLAVAAQESVTGHVPAGTALEPFIMQKPQ